MEDVLQRGVGTNVGRNAEAVRNLEMAESKAEAGDGFLKEVNRKSQHKKEAKIEYGKTIGAHIKICKRGKPAATGAQPS